MYPLHFPFLGTEISSLKYNGKYAKSCAYCQDLLVYDPYTYDLNLTMEGIWTGNCADKNGWKLEGRMNCDGETFCYTRISNR